MAVKITGFEPVAGVKDTFAAHNLLLRCTAIRLSDGSLCLYSPVAGLGKLTLDSLSKLGTVKFLLAPNHYHNKALVEYQQAFPKAKPCAPTAAMPRLAKVTGQKFQNLTKLSKLLPKHLSFIEPEGLKNGEVWLKAAAKAGNAWFVVDAFSGEKMTAKKTRSAKVGYLKTFPNFGVQDKAVYREWVLARLGTDKPTTIVPCHGATMDSKNLTKAAVTAVKQMLD